MSKTLFDSHAHYYDTRFSEEHDGGADDILASVFADNVGYIINVGTSNENSDACIEQAKKYEGMYAAVGIHPSDCRFYTDVDAEIEKLRKTLMRGKKDKIVALGEIGFDYHYENTDKEKQAAFFEAQMRLAKELGLPVIIHDRDAHGDTMDMLRRFPDVTGVVHSFSGSAEMARELVKMGWYVSFSGVVTFKNAARSKESAAAVPLDRILCETDAPYLAPHPHRGELNHSGLMHLTVKTLSEVCGVSFEEMAEITRKNAAKLFGIDIF